MIMRMMKEIGKAFRALMALLVIAIALFPLVWMILTAFKERTEIFEVPITIIPRNFEFLNFSEVLHKESFLRSLWTTFLGATVLSIGNLLINGAGAYAFARINFRGKKALWSLALLPMYIPGVATMVPTFMVIHKMGLMNTYSALILPGLASAGNVFFLRQYFLGIPLSLEEASQIDGCDRIQAFFKLFVHMAIPPFVLTGVGAFLAYWNNYLWPLLVLSDTLKYPVMLELQFYRSQWDVHYGVLMAASFIAALPPAILFLIFQKYLVQGIKIAGLK